MSGLGRLISPTSIAIAGLSADPAKHGRRVLGHLQRFGFGGPIYGVNPGLPEVEGVEMVRSLAELDFPPDLVVSAVPAPAAVEVVESAGGVGAVVVFAGGFGESGEPGMARETRLRDAARATGVRLLGPNSGGIIRPKIGLAASFLTCLDRPADEIRAGRVGLVTQSGGTGSYVHNLAAARGSGLAISVSTGNEVDVELGEAIGAVAGLDDVEVVLVVMETVRDGEKFIESIRACHELGKPVVVCRIGTGTIGRQMMTSHTGAMAVPERVVVGVLSSLGVTVAATPEEAYEVAQVVADLGPTGSRTGIVTHSGGLAILLADLAEREGVALPVPSADLGAAVESLLDHGVVANPLDMGGIIGGPGRFAEVVGAFVDSGDFDVVMAVSSAHPPTHTAERVESLVVMDTEVPVFHLWMAGDQGADGLRRLRETGVAVATEPRVAMKALATRHPSFEPRPSSLSGSYMEWGLPLIAQDLARDADEAVAIAEELGFPVVVKLIADEVTHKTELGGVRLDLRSGDEVRRAFEQVTAAALDGGHVISGATVSRFRPGLEMIVGGQVDPVFGPLVSLGFGGIATEAIGDVTFAPAPVTAAEAGAMLDRLRMRPLLDDVRGQPPADVDTLVGIAEAVGRGIAGGRYTEFEINPLIWDGEWVAVDVLAVE